MDVAPREKFGLGSKLKKFVRKVIPNEIADIAVKAAPFVAPFNPALAAGMAGIGSFDQTGSISKGLRKAALNYAGGQLARYAGGAGFQGNPFTEGGAFRGGLEGFKAGFSSPIGTDTGLKLGQYKMFGGQPAPQPEVISGGEYGQYAQPTFGAGDALGGEGLTGTLEQATGSLANTGAQTGAPKYTDLLKQVVSPDATLAERGSALKDLGGKALKDIYTDKDGKLDKSALFATISGATSYIEALGLAEDAGVDTSEYTEEMYEADKQKYKDRYDELLPDSAFGLKDGGRVKYAFGSDPDMLEDGKNVGIPSITLEKKDDMAKGIDTLEDEMLMAGGITFSSAEKSYLFRKLAGAGGSDRSFTMPQLYGILNNPNSPGNINDAKVLKEIAVMGLGSGKKDGGRIGYKEGANERVKELESLIEKLMTEQGIQDRGYAAKLAMDLISMKDKDIDSDRLKFLNNESALFALPRDMRPEDGYYDALNALEKRTNFLEGGDTEYNSMVTRMYIEAGGEEGTGMTIDEFADQYFKKFADGGMGGEVPVRKNAGGIMELDYRNTGGFVPIGVKERADDVPAMLSKNEFVFTADAVRGAGNGDINKGAQKMYKTMKQLEGKAVV